MLTKAEQAYNMGVAAYKAGKDYDDCPFTFTNEYCARREWMDGFDDAQEQMESVLHGHVYDEDERA